MATTRPWQRFPTTTAGTTINTCVHAWATELSFRDDTSLGGIQPQRVCTAGNACRFGSSHHQDPRLFSPATTLGIPGKCRAPSADLTSPVDTAALLSGM